MIVQPATGFQVASVHSMDVSAMAAVLVARLNQIDTPDDRAIRGWKRYVVA
jgi:hypothetical protein